MSASCCFLCSGIPTFACALCKESHCHLCEFGLAEDGRLCVKCGIYEASTRIEELQDEIEDIECDCDTIKNEEKLEDKREENLNEKIDEYETAKNEAEDRLEILIMEMESKLAEAKMFLERINGS